VTCTLRGRERAGGGEGTGRGNTREEGREEETRIEGWTSEAVETETEDEVKGRAVDGKEGWGAEAVSNEAEESGAG